MPEKKPDEKRGTISFLLIIFIAYLFGLFLKRVQLGLIIGLVLGLLGSGMLRKRD